MLAWTRTEDGWQLQLGEAEARDPSLPRLEVRRVKGAWVICLLTREFGRARTGTIWSLEGAQRAAVVEAQRLLDRGYWPLLDQTLSNLNGRTLSANSLRDTASDVFCTSHRA